MPPTRPNALTEIWGLGYRIARCQFATGVVQPRRAWIWRVVEKRRPVAVGFSRLLCRIPIEIEIPLPGGLQNRKQIRGFAELEFIAKAENIVFVGKTAVGKTGLASGLLMKALENGYITHCRVFSAKFVW